MDERTKQRTRGSIPGVDRRLPVGAEVLPAGSVHFRVWATKPRRIEVVLQSGPGAPGSVPLKAEPDGYFAGLAPSAAAGTRYLLRLGGPDGPLVPDPASRYQPEGLHGPSEVVDPSAARWTDHNWRGVGSREGQVLYELHVGTFTPEGTWISASEQLPRLAELGVTVIEVMPVAEFAGEFGWGYDGVLLFAPFHGYGSPDDLRRFVDRAHSLGLAVILDVVYNHLGPGCELYRRFSDEFFSAAHKTEWGDSPNFDGPGSEAVRAFILANVEYWVDEFHVDGMRIDGTQALFDTSPDHILGAIARRMREAADGRQVLAVGENESQHVRLLRDAGRGGLGLDMVWSDDFHHAARVAVTGLREAYFGDYQGTPQELISALKYGWLYQGQWNPRQRKRRGTPAREIPPWAFVNYLQNHDQVANSGRGERLNDRTTRGRLRAATAMLLLGPGTPLLFQGQEYADPAPFLYFSDQEPGLAEEFDRGRKESLAQFASLATDEMRRCLPFPADPDVFRRSKLNPDMREQGPHAEVEQLHRDLLRLRREDPTIRAGGRPGAVDGAVLGPEALALRWFDPEGTGDDRLMLVNLGIELNLKVVAEPLLAPPEDRRWRIRWSSEDPRYGGCGTPEPETEEQNWRLQGHAAIVLTPVPVPAGVDEHRNPPGTP
ncbi:MAG: malto-oligosyltrehalose trehalohydrolase [Isosphaeraceae bacterium]